MCTHLALTSRRVPNQPSTPTRSVRIPDELWEAALRAAEDNDETVTDVILAALRRYVRDHPSTTLPEADG